MKEIQSSHEERFKWRQTMLSQELTSLNNLGIAFCVGIIAFILSMLKEEKFKTISSQKIMFDIGIIMTLCSFTLGICTAFLRLKAFRRTVRIMRREQHIKETEVISKSSLLYTSKLIIGRKRFQSWMWGFFYLQITTFFIAVLSFLIAFVITYWDKLF